MSCDTELSALSCDGKGLVERESPLANTADVGEIALLCRKSCASKLLEGISSSLSFFVISCS